jgi:5-methyltetrahydrofolate--homocysteine methyltransferase
MLQKRGAVDNPVLYNITRPQLVQEIHKSFTASGSEVLYTNTFGCSKYQPEEYSLNDIIKAAIANAKSAAKQRALVAYDMGPSGKLLEPMGDLSFDEAYQIFREQAELAQSLGADLIVCETFSDLREIKAAVLAVKENTNLPLICTMTFEKNLRTFQGVPISSAALTLEGSGADAVGLNCTLTSADMAQAVQELVKWTDLPLIIKPNLGMPRIDGSYDETPKQFAQNLAQLINLGVSGIGGCCGTTPEHIAELKKLTEGKSLVKREKISVTAACSPLKTVNIDGVKIVGERLNPTGKKDYKQALISGDTDYIINQGIDQTDAGADILDLNCGLPEIDEAKAMESAVTALQSVTRLPLQIDSANPKAIESGLRAYCGKAIVNSVTGDDESLDSILPLVKKYGALVIGLTLDKSGLPETVERRIEIAKKIIDRARSYGIKKSDVIIDPLTLTLSAEQRQAQCTLSAIREFKKMGIKTVLGISNISFGLPQREALNAAFLTAALSCGLSLAIINPLSKAMTDAVAAYKVISGQDGGAEQYIKRFGGEHGGGDAADIKYCIIKGLKNECKKAAVKLLGEYPPLDVVNNYIIPALDEVGFLYEKGKLFLPQLINSAETAKAAFEEINKKLPKDNKKTDSTVLLATVKGDIHDIGKNIVRAVLENYGYNIIDLGKDAPPELIVKTVIEKGVKLAGLSALMTTTLSGMEETIKLLRQQAPNCKIAVGGAVLTEEYARKIGADYYAKDANAAVKIAKEVFD